MTKLLKLLITLVLLSMSAVYAVSQTVTVVATKDGMAYTNTGKKDVVLIVGHEVYSSGDVSPFGMDSIDNATAFPAGATHSQSVPYDDPSGKYVVTFLQFADGTSWGDNTTDEAKFARMKRQAKLDFIAGLASATSTDEFVAKLAAFPTSGPGAGPANFVRGQVATAGADLAFQHVQKRYSIALSRKNMWMF